MAAILVLVTYYSHVLLLHIKCVSNDLEVSQKNKCKLGVSPILATLAKFDFDLLYLFIIFVGVCLIYLASIMIFASTALEKPTNQPFEVFPI